MNIYAHAAKEAKRISARLLDKVVKMGMKKLSLVLARKEKTREST